MYWRHLVATLVGILLLAACTTIRGSGTLKTESRPVSTFTAVDLSGSGHLTIEQTGTESLTIEAEDNILPLLTSDVSNGTLRLGEKDTTNILTSKTINYRLTVRDLNNLTVSGSGDVTAPSLTASTLTVRLSGSGSMTLGGTADTQAVTISGSGRYDAAKLASKSVSIDISGSGIAVVMPSDTLNATIGGNGSLEYIGNPTVTQNISGSGRISKR